MPTMMLMRDLDPQCCLTSLQEALDIRIADFKGCDLLSLLLLLFEKSSTFCRRCPDPEIRIFQLLQRPLKMCTNSRAFKLAMHASKSLFHAVDRRPVASDSAAPAAPAGHRRSEPESESDSESGAAPGPGTVTDRPWPGAGSGESALYPVCPGPVLAAMYAVHSSIAGPWKSDSQMAPYSVTSWRPARWASGSGPGLAATHPGHSSILGPEN